MPMNLQTPRDRSFGLMNTFWRDSKIVQKTKVFGELSVPEGSILGTDLLSTIAPSGPQGSMVHFLKIELTSDLVVGTA